MSDVYFQAAPGQNFEEYVRQAGSEGMGIEVTDFAFPALLDSNWREVLDRRLDSLRDFEGPISMHGVFAEMTVHSLDSRIQEVSRARIEHDLKIADELGARYVVFHTNLIPLIKADKYYRRWVDCNARFWSETIGRYRCAVLLENLWEPTPQHLCALLEKVDSPQLGVCLDVGHVNVFSSSSYGDWFAALGDRIGYMHVHDNHGTRDEHLVPGEGTVDWRVFSDDIIRQGIDPGVVFEVDTLAMGLDSLSYFRRHGVFPFQTAEGD
jgi:sugar phosphate isomerase/epimerase